MNHTNKNKWDTHYASCKDELPEPAEVLLNNQYLLPDHGTALDLACGRGANALLLAKHGLTVSAWDISSAALKHLDQNANKNNLSIKSECRDVTLNPPLPNIFDIIIVSRFLERSLIPDIRAAIKSRGLILYQTFIMDKIDNNGPGNPDYLLAENELLSFFNDWKILVYREEGGTGDIKHGFRNQAMLIAQKP